MPEMNNGRETQGKIWEKPEALHGAETGGP